jgi:hypothetical protein
MPPKQLPEIDTRQKERGLASKPFETLQDELEFVRANTSIESRARWYVLCYFYLVLVSIGTYLHNAIKAATPP